tara:strand:+ start:1174 stop:1392 length:219 start_codon:yes stop_codon:yes gene_type:complete
MTKEENVKKEILDSLYKVHGKDCFSVSKISKTRMSLQIGKSSVSEFNVDSEDKEIMKDVFDELLEVCKSKLN